MAAAPTGLFQASFCHTADSPASVNGHTTFFFLPHSSVYQKTVSRIRIIPSILSDGTGDFLLSLMDIQDLQMEQDPFGRHQIDVFYCFSGQEHPRSCLCRRSCTGTGGVTIPEFFVVFDHIVIFQSVLHRTLLPFLLPTSAFCLQKPFSLYYAGVLLSTSGA